MGHDGLIQLNKNYFREHVDELISEYVSAITFLTIDDSLRKQLELDKIKEEKSQLEKTHIPKEDVKKMIQDEIKKTIRESFFEPVG